MAQACVDGVALRQEHSSACMRPVPTPCCGLRTPYRHSTAAPQHQQGTPHHSLVQALAPHPDHSQSTESARPPLHWPPPPPAGNAAIDIGFVYHHRTRWSSVEFLAGVRYCLVKVCAGHEVAGYCGGRMQAA